MDITKGSVYSMADSGIVEVELPQVTVITVYSRPVCIQCKATYRALDNHGIEYDVHNLIESSAELIQLFKSLGHLQAPIVLTPEGRVWHGFDPDEINALQIA